MILGVCNWLSHESKINVIIIRFTFILSLFFGNAPVFLTYFSIYLVMKYLSEACINVIICKAYGIYNTSGPKVMSIYEIVVEIAKHFNLPLQNIQRINSKILAQKAKRPKFTGFELTKAKKKFNYTPKTFKESLSIIETQIKINK